AYKLERISHALAEKRAGHPASVVMLTADAFGVLPPIARLTHDQALFYFLSGFTAKLAGTEIGVTEPQPTFSTCFGAPFLPQPPVVYAEMLGRKLDDHGAVVWLVNTGWTGGPFGEGERMPIAATRTLLRTALDGDLEGVEYRTETPRRPTPSRTPSTRSRAPTTSATKTRSRSCATRLRATSTSSRTGARSSRAPRTAASPSAPSARRVRRALRTRPTSPATCS